MKKLFLVLLTVLAAGCGDSGKKGTKSEDMKSDGMVGIWAIDHSYSYGGDYKELFEEAPSQYVHLTISGNGQASYSMLGTSDIHDKVLYQEKTMTLGKVKMLSKTEALVTTPMNPKSPCHLTLASSSKLEFRCPDEGGKLRDDATTFDRISGSQAAHVQKEVKKTIASILQLKSQLSQKIGGKRFILVEEKTEWINPDGTQGSTTRDLSQVKDEDGTGENRSINALRLKFAPNVETAYINDKHPATIRLNLANDRTSLIMTLSTTIREGSFRNHLRGTILATGNETLVVKRPYMADKKEYVLTVTYKLAR
jgi:hypothetical protein